MRISLIVAIYKDIRALSLIIESLMLQDYNDFEVIVAEDNNTNEIGEYLNTIKGIDILHTTQKDIGIRKARSQNNAIIKSTGDYLIFIDGDCIPYTTFISSHTKLAEKGCILSGRRVNLGPRTSSFIRKGTLKSRTLERFYYAALPVLQLDGATHTGQGISFDPDGYFYQNIISKRKKTNINLLGCNFSCFKSDMLAINGFDESYGEMALPDDTDIQWRLEVFGLKLKSCKMAANVFHLYHKIKTVNIPDEEGRSSKARMIERKSAGLFEASIGLSTHNT